MQVYSEDGKIISPVIAGDNYVTLFPEERRSIELYFPCQDLRETSDDIPYSNTRKQNLYIVLHGFNFDYMKIPVEM